MTDAACASGFQTSADTAVNVKRTKQLNLEPLSEPRVKRGTTVVQLELGAVNEQSQGFVAAV